MKQMKHMKRTELADQRTANRKVFENQDHSRTVEIYLEPVHYQDRGGNWQEMDDTLQWIWKAQCRKIKSRDF